MDNLNPYGAGTRQFGSIVPGVFTPVLAKHSKSFLLIDCIAVGVDRMQRNFEPMRKQVEAWQRSELTDVTAKAVIYEAFIEGRLEAPKTSCPHRVIHTAKMASTTKSAGRSLRPHGSERSLEQLSQLTFHLSLAKIQICLHNDNLAI